MNHQTRVIVVGQYELAAVVCEICPGTAAIFPQAEFEKHLRRHAMPKTQNAEINLSWRHEPPRYRRGRTKGSRNFHTMSSTGVECKRINIRAK